jgi:hypothetical protein
LFLLIWLLVSFFLLLVFFFLQTDSTNHSLPSKEECSW